MTVQDVLQRRARQARADLDIPAAPGYRSLRQRQAERAGSRRLVIIASTIGCALVAVGCVWEYANHRNRAVPVIEADSRPLRIKPENPGGMQVAGAGEGILSGNGRVPEALAPPPELPDTGALLAQEQASHTRDAAPVAAAGILPGLGQQGVAIANPPAPSPPAKVTEAKPVTAPPRAVPVTARPAALAPAGGNRQVQFVAVASEAAANAEWERLSHRMPELLSSHRPEVTEVEHDGHIFWRLRTGGFADAAAAAAFCTQVRAKGANCAPAGQ